IPPFPQFPPLPQFPPGGIILITEGLSASGKGSLSFGAACDVPVNNNPPMSASTATAAVNLTNTRPQDLTNKKT
ncbi:hypothetical protein, partial [Mycobacterium haemophilum]